MDKTQLFIVELDDRDIGNENFIRKLASENKNARKIGFMKQV